MLYSSHNWPTAIFVQITRVTRFTHRQWSVEREFSDAMQYMYIRMETTLKSSYTPVGVGEHLQLCHLDGTPSGIMNRRRYNSMYTKMVRMKLYARHIYSHFYFKQWQIYVDCVCFCMFCGYAELREFRNIDCDCNYLLWHLRRRILYRAYNKSL